MRRAYRLFQIVQLLRARELVTAAELAAELEVSERTIYRDIRDLSLSGIPIQGEAGVGYALPPRFDLPPLMFDRGEIQALVLGASMVRAFADDELARQAASALVKIAAVLPDELRPRVQRLELLAPTFPRETLTENLATVRQAVEGRRSLSFRYERGDGEASVRTVRPLGLYFWGTSWTLVAWCELREDFRSFRPDRMRILSVGAEPHPVHPGRELADFLRRMQGEQEFE